MYIHEEQAILGLLFLNTELDQRKHNKAMLFLQKKGPFSFQLAANLAQS